MDPITSVAGLICASALFFYFVQLDRQRQAVGELPPTDETEPVAMRRRTIGYRLDRLGRRVLGSRLGRQRSSIDVRLNLAGNPGHPTPAAFEAIHDALADLLGAVSRLAGLLLRLPLAPMRG